MGDGASPTNGCNDHEHNHGQIFLHTNDGATPRLYGCSSREPSPQGGFVARAAAPMNEPTSNNKHTIEKELRFLGLDVHAKNLTLALDEGGGGEPHPCGTPLSTRAAVGEDGHTPQSISSETPTATILHA